MKKKKKYEIIESEVEFKEQGFEYSPFMTFAYDGAELSVLGIYDSKEEALDALKPYKSQIKKVGNCFLVKEYYIADGLFDEDDEFVEGSNAIAVAPLETAEV